MPTGSGKTVVFSHLIDRTKPKNKQGNKTLILVHRKELALQAAEKCKKASPDKLVEVEMAKYKASKHADIVVASVQTLMRGRLEKFDPDQFKLIIVDEAHHAAAASYKHVLEHFGVDKTTSDIALVGFSATMRREDTKALGEIFDDIVFHMDLQDMILQNHLSDVQFTTVQLVDADLRKVASHGGDFVISGLSKTVNTPANNDLATRTYLYFESSHKIKSTLVFGVDIQHVHDLCEKFRSAGVSAECVTSKTKPSERERLIEQFRKGEVSVLINCGIFTEGTDIPNIDCIFLVRPTKSKNLLVQMIGRGLRLHDSKEICRVVDFVGIGNRDVVTTPTLGGLSSDFAVDGYSIGGMHELKREMQKQQEEELERRKLEKNERLMVELTQYERNAVKNIRFTTYENLAHFLANTTDLDDAELLETFKEPWFKGPKENMWVLVWPRSSTGIHLRLEAHSNRIPEDFYDDLETNGFEDTFDRSNGSADKTYTLTLYRERPEFKNKKKSNFYVKRFTKELVAPMSSDIRTLLLKARLLLQETLGYNNMLKSSKWRSGPASSLQLETYWNALQKVLAGSSIEERTHIRSQIQKLTKGRISDMLSSYGIFKTAALKKDLLSLRAMNRSDSNLPWIHAEMATRDVK
jgi:ATP-dependent helicase IRC3